MANAQTRGWGPPCDVPKLTLVRSDGLRLPTHRDIMDLVAMLMDLTELMGYDILPGETWGGLCRKISGTNTWSNHAWWLAIDLNAPSNPYASAEWHRRNARGTKPFGLQIVCNIPQNVIELWEAYGFFWGGRYKNKPDPMHMEFLQSPAKARELTAKLRKWIDDNGSAPAPDPIPLPPTKEIDMHALIVCDPARVNELPDSMIRTGNPWFFTDGDEFWWCPTVGHAQLQFDLGLCKTPTAVHVSPSFIKELRPRCAADMAAGSSLLGGNDPKYRHYFFKQDGTVHPNALD